MLNKLDWTKMVGVEVVHNPTTGNWIFCCWQDHPLRIKRVRVLAIDEKWGTSEEAIRWAGTNREWLRAAPEYKGNTLDF